MPQGCGWCGSRQIMRIRTTASCQTPCIKYPLPFTGEQKYFVCMYMLEFQLVDMALSWRCPVFIIWVLCLSKHSSFLFRLKENLQKHKKSNKNVTFSRSKLICCRVASKCFCFQVHCMVLFWEWHSSGVPASVPILLYSRCFSLLQHEIQ